MPTPRDLKSPPITEAIFDIRVKARANFKAEDFSQLTLKLKGDLPKFEKISGGKLTLNFSPSGGKPSFEELGFQGYFCKSEDEKLIAQFRIDGFTVNRLKPYAGWSNLLSGAMEFWGLYCESASPETITRLALRYINHIPIPFTSKLNLDDFLRGGPKIPEELPQFPSKFFSRVTLIDESNISAHVVQALERGVSSNGVRLLLDIDTFQEVDLDDPQDPEIEIIFGRIRDFKNKIFFNYLTDHTLRQFE